MLNPIKSSLTQGVNGEELNQIAVAVFKLVRDFSVNIFIVYGNCFDTIWYWNFSSFILADNDILLFCIDPATHVW